MGVGARSEISFILAKPWSSIFIAILAEMGTFVTLAVGILAFNLQPEWAAAIATIGGADGPMVLFASLMLAPELFVPISIIAYLYLSLTYGGYPYIIKLFVPKKYRGIDMLIDVPEVSQKAKFIFIVVICLVLCLLLPVAAPLILSFFLGMAIKEAEVLPYQDLLEDVITYASTFFLGLLLGTLCEASTILNPTVVIILILGIMALAISAVGGLIGGWICYFIHKARKQDFNPVVGIAGVSCVPTTAKLAQHAAQDENPFCMILNVAMGANISGVIVSAIAAGIFITTLGLIVI
jgi:oxaloacetate decarboxylase beta subunit